MLTYNKIHLFLLLALLYNGRCLAADDEKLVDLYDYIPLTTTAYSLSTLLIRNPSAIVHEKDTLSITSDTYKINTIDSLASLPALAGCKALTKINFSHNVLECINFNVFTECTTLTSLNFSHNKITDYILPEKPCNSMTILNISHNNLNNKNIIRDFASTYPSLLHLDLNHNKLIDIDLGIDNGNQHDDYIDKGYAVYNKNNISIQYLFNQLESLSLRDNQIQKIDLDQIKNISNPSCFKTFDISNNPIIHVVPPRIQLDHNESTIVPTLVCNDLSKNIINTIAKHAVVTNNDFIASCILYSVFTSGLESLLVLYPATSSFLPRMSFPIACVYVGGLWLLTGSVNTLVLLRLESSKKIFYTHYKMASNTFDKKAFVAKL